MTGKSALRVVSAAPSVAPVAPASPAAAPPPRGWQPPTRHRRWGLAVLVLIGAGALARSLPQPDPASTEIAGAREVTAYELVAGEPLVFSLPPGATELRVLTNLDLPAQAPPEGVPYTVRVRIPEDGRDDTFPLMAMAPLDASGARTAFFLGRKELPASTRMLSLVRSSALPATLEILLPAPAAARASLRVLVSHELLAARSAPPPRSPGTAGLPPEDLAPEARAAFESRTWGRLSMRSKTATRGFYVIGGPPPPTPRPVGEVIGDGHVAAFTVAGPGTVHLEAPEGLSGQATVLDRGGITHLERLALAPGGRVSLAIGAGLTTLRVTSPRRSRVNLVGEARLMARAEPGSTAAAGDEGELAPVWSWQSLALAGPDGPPVEIAVGGRGDAGLRLSARLPLGATPGPAPEGELRWRFVDARGTQLDHGRLIVGARPAPEDRLDGAEAFVSAATVAFLWPPRGAERLLLTAARPVAVSLSSPGLESSQAPAQELDIDPTLVLRNRASLAFVPVRPLNQAALRRLGRIVRFAGALRLEPRAVPPPAAPDASSLAPERAGAQFVLLSPLAGPAPANHRDGLSFAVRPNRDEGLLVARPRGASARARVAATVYYEVERVRGRGSLTVSLDGHVVRRASLQGKRGQLVLPPIPVGRHRLRVDLPAEGRVFVDQPVSGADAFRRSRVFTLTGGGAHLRLPKGAAARSLGVVFYLDGPPAEGASIEATIDGGARLRRRTGLSTGYTRLQRRTPLYFQKLEGARYLNRARSGVWASGAVFVPLGDDLGPGSHRIALRTQGMGAAPLARFFSYGAPLGSRINQHVELRAEAEE
jgi:hypothetical protein